MSSCPSLSSSCRESSKVNSQTCGCLVLEGHLSSDSSTRSVLWVLLMFVLSGCACANVLCMLCQCIIGWERRYTLLNGIVLPPSEGDKFESLRGCYKLSVCMLATVPSHIYFFRVLLWVPINIRECVSYTTWESVVGLIFWKFLLALMLFTLSY